MLRPDAPVFTPTRSPVPSMPVHHPFLHQQPETSKLEYRLQCRCGRKFINWPPCREHAIHCRAMAKIDYQDLVDENRFEMRDPSQNPWVIPPNKPKTTSSNPKQKKQYGCLRCGRKYFSWNPCMKHVKDCCRLRQVLRDREISHQAFLLNSTDEEKKLLAATDTILATTLEMVAQQTRDMPTHTRSQVDRQHHYEKRIVREKVNRERGWV